MNLPNAQGSPHYYQLSFLYDLEGVIGFIYADASNPKERYVFVKNILGEMITRTVIVGGTAAIIRAIIEWLFNLGNQNEN